MDNLFIRKQAAKGNLIADLARSLWFKGKGAAGWVDDKAMKLGERLGTKKLAEVLEARAYKSAGKAADARSAYDFMSAEALKNKAINQMRLAEIMDSDAAKRVVGYGAGAVGAAGTAGAGYGAYRGGKALVDALSKDSENKPTEKDTQDPAIASRPAVANRSSKQDNSTDQDSYRKNIDDNKKLAIKAGGLLGSTAAGAGIGAFIDRRNRLRGMLIGGATAAGLTGLGLYLYDKNSKNS